MNPFNYYIEVLQKYAQFSGRARRAEYWYFVLFNIIIAFVLGFFSALIEFLGFVPFLYNLAVLIPGLAVFVRRLHDTGRSGWWFFIGLIPIIGTIVLLIFACEDSQPGANQYGDNPKGV
jgi:uncharacterized membrane protein YhaH (DUF805 family)